MSCRHDASAVHHGGVCSGCADPDNLRGGGVPAHADRDAPPGRLGPPSPPMTRKRRRLWILLACGLGLGSATALVLSAFRDNLVFFLAPSDVASRAPVAGRSFRLGGLVEQGSVQRTTDDGHPAAKFRVTDGKAGVEVSYQ